MSEETKAATPLTERQEKIFEAVRDICVQELGVSSSKVQLHSKFVEDLGCDSLDQVELTMEFEDRFDLCIDDEAAATMMTVRDAVLWLDANHAVV